MNLSPSTTAGPALFGPESGPGFMPSIDPRLTERQEDFASIIGRKQFIGKLTPEEQAREAAEDFVSISFVQPVLAQLRSTNTAAAPFTPTRGEQQFQSMADAQLARKIVRASQFPLVDRLARDLLRRGIPADGAAQ
jgi:Rod binding domain-containing protein